jgi:hypothetical protein
MRPENPAQQFAILAIVASGKKVGVEIPLTKGYVDVELRVNGEVVPFEHTIVETFRRMEATVAQQAADLAVEVVDVQGILDDLAQFRKDLRGKLAAKFGVQIRDEEW